MKIKHQKYVFRSPRHTKTISLAISGHKYYKDVQFTFLFFAHMEVNVAANFGFVYLNLLVSKVSIWPTKLL